MYNCTKITIKCIRSRCYKVCGTNFILELFLPMFDCIGSVMVSVLTSSAVDRRFESRSDKTTRLAWNQDNVV
jgi:hypothetical protein